MGVVPDMAVNVFENTPGERIVQNVVEDVLFALPLRLFFGGLFRFRRFRFGIGLRLFGLGVSFVSLFPGACVGFRIRLGNGSSPPAFGQQNIRLV